MIPKFRAWVKDYQVMRSVEFLAFNEKGVAEIFTNPEDGEPEDFRHTHSPEQAILMQSTGLKDINDKEIYEGDVIIPDGGGASLVHWRDGAFQVGYYGDIPYVLADYKSLTVIGNIYENPELKKELMEVIE